MSGGQKRLVEIMRALMLKPRLLLLDEPMSGVHPKIVEEIQYYLQDLRSEGITILMVEHELHMVERLCDSVVVMAQGKVIGSGTMASLRKQPEIVDAYRVGEPGPRRGATDPKPAGGACHVGLWRRSRHPRRFARRRAG
jgi:ABC-type branched-subunit amino acid transport system ATPase component